MSAIPRCDMHTHTKYLKCANETMEIPAMVQEAQRIGVTALGITDHLNTLDKLPLHRPIRDDITALEPPMDIYFGVELNFLGPDGGLAFSQEVKEEMGFQFAIGGIHSAYVDTYDLPKMIDIQHHHHLKICYDPLVDVLVHPYWFGKGEFDQKGWPWLDTMSPVPERYAHELGQVARETGTAIEINACANLANPRYSERYVEEYIAYLAIVAEEGPLFSLGSDAHDIGRMQTVLTAWQVAERLGLSAERIWQPPCAPMVSRR